MTTVGSIGQNGAAQVVNPVSGTGLSPEIALDPDLPVGRQHGRDDGRRQKLLLLAG